MFIKTIFFFGLIRYEQLLSRFCIIPSWKKGGLFSSFSLLTFLLGFFISSLYINENWKLYPVHLSLYLFNCGCYQNCHPEFSLFLRLIPGFSTHTFSPFKTTETIQVSEQYDRNFVSRTCRLNFFFSFSLPFGLLFIYFLNRHIKKRALLKRGRFPVAQQVSIFLFFSSCCTSTYISHTTKYNILLPNHDKNTFFFFEMMQPIDDPVICAGCVFPPFLPTSIPYNKEQIFLPPLHIIFGCMMSLLIVLRENNIILCSTQGGISTRSSATAVICFVFLSFLLLNFVDLFSYYFWMYDGIANAEIKKNDNSTTAVSNFLKTISTEFLTILDHVINYVMHIVFYAS